MARQIKNKTLLSTRLANNYGGWIYCDNCGENIGNLCYQTYDNVEFKYTCNCGNQGCMQMDFVDSEDGNESTDEMITIKNRLSCPKDNEPMITLLEKKLKTYDVKITCKTCHNTYTKSKK